jgi:hypothetical protein
MARMTITEALADIKTTQARIEKKRRSILEHVVRDSRFKDPMEAEGGTVEYIKRERQAVHDLEEKIVKIRSAIQRANLEIRLEIGGVERTLAAWLNWRREVAQGAGLFLEGLVQRIGLNRAHAGRVGLAREPAPAPGMQQADVVVNVPERELAEEIEKHATILGQLDGKLSLLNATTTVDV